MSRTLFLVVITFTILLPVFSDHTGVLPSSYAQTKEEAKKSKKKKKVKKRRKKRSQRKRYKRKRPKRKSRLKRGADKVIKSGKAVVDKSKVVVEKTFDRVEGTRDVLTEKVFLISTSIDEFFSNEDSLDKENRSYVRLSLRSIAEKYRKTDTDFLISSRLSLPNIQKNLHLIFNSDEEDSEDDATGTNTASANDKDTSYQAGLRYDFFSWQGFKTNLDGGVKLKDPIDPFVKLRIRKDIYRLYFQYKFKQTFAWYQQDGYESDTEFFMDHPFSYKTLFRIYTAGKWNEGGELENPNLWTFHHNWNIIHLMGLKQAITYQIGADGTDEPEVHLSTWHASIGIRRLAYKDWLYVTLKPAIVWRKEDSFKLRTQFTLRFDMIIGDTPSRRARAKYLKD